MHRHLTNRRNVISLTAAYHNAIKRNKEDRFSKVMGRACVKAIDSNDSETAVNIISSTAIAISISITQGDFGAAATCATSFADVVTKSQGCTVIVKEFVVILFQVCVIFIKRSRNVIRFG